MDYFLARVFGIVLMAVYGGVLLNLPFFKRLWAGIPKQQLSLFITGFIALVLGLLTLQVHNVWTFDWRVLITLLGWLLVVNGIWRTMFAENALRITEKFASFDDTVVYSIAGVMFAIGAYLTLVGYSIL